MVDFPEYDCKDGLCPECLDECLKSPEHPIFATDTSDVYLYRCPVCGYKTTYAEWVTPEEQTGIHHTEIGLFQIALNPGDVGSGYRWE